MSVGIHTSNGFVKVAGLGMGATPMVGATETTNGKAGLVPAPSIASRNKFLKGDGTWAEINSESSLESVKTYIDDEIGKLPEWTKEATKPSYTPDEVGADSKGSAASALTLAKLYTDEEIGKLEIPTKMSLSGATLTLETNSGSTLSTVTLPVSSVTTSTTEPENPYEGQIWIG